MAPTTAKAGEDRTWTGRLGWYQGDTSELVTNGLVTNQLAQGGLPRLQLQGRLSVL